MVTPRTQVYESSPAQESEVAPIMQSSAQSAQAQSLLWTTPEQVARILEVCEQISPHGRRMTIACLPQTSPKSA